MLLVGLVLSGCAGPAARPVPPSAPESPGAAHATRVTAFDAWRLTGRIAVQRDDQGFSADLEWRQDGPAFDLRVTAPLNGGTFRLLGAAGEVALATPDGNTYRAPDAESLMREHLGWSLPLDGARYWIRGVPGPHAPPAHEVTDDAGRWSDFEQDRWRVSVLDYTDLDGLALPRKLFLLRDDLRVRLVMRRWERL